MNHDFNGLINSTSNARLRIQYLAVSVKAGLKSLSFLK